MEVNCSLTTWSAWENCSTGAETVCGTGNGTQMRVRRVEREAQHGGWDCQGDLEETRFGFAFNWLVCFVQNL